MYRDDPLRRALLIVLMVASATAIAVATPAGMPVANHAALGSFKGPPPPPPDPGG